MYTKATRAFIYKDSVVVIDKEDIELENIHGVEQVKDEDFREVLLLLTEDFIENAYEELEAISDYEDDF